MSRYVEGGGTAGPSTTATIKHTIHDRRTAERRRKPGVATCGCGKFSFLLNDEGMTEACDHACYVGPYYEPPDPWPTEYKAEFPKERRCWPFFHDWGKWEMVEIAEPVEGQIRMTNAQERRCRSCGRYQRRGL